VFLLSIVALQIKGQDTATFITVGLLLLGIAGYSLGKVEAVQKQTNGGQEKLIQVIKESSERQAELIKLVASLPPPPVQEVKTIDGEVKPNDEFVGSTR
jgi:uncharacterized protein HemX